MRYCLSARQPLDMQKKADELLVLHNDYRYIPELFMDFPEKMIILDVPNDKLEELKDSIKSYHEANPNYFCCRVYKLTDVNWFVENGIKFYYGYPVSTFYDLAGLVAVGVEYVVITAPLTFQIGKLKRLYHGVKFRMVPNVAYDAYIPRKDGICGQWVRPEGIKFYESAIYIFDFEDCDNLIKERTLYHIYAEQKNWPGNLNLLLTNLGIDLDNRLIGPEIDKVRANCGQKCQEASFRCGICGRLPRFEKILRDLKRQRDEQKGLI